MSYSTIRYETAGAIARITLNRPERLNAWTPKMSEEQADAIERANGDKAIGAIVMTGEGVDSARAPISGNVQVAPRGA